MAPLVIVILMIFGLASCGSKRITISKKHLWPRPLLEKVQCQSRNICSGEELKKYDRNFMKILEDNYYLRTAPVWKNPEDPID